MNRKKMSREGEKERREKREKRKEEIFASPLSFAPSRLRGSIPSASLRPSPVSRYMDDGQCWLS
jgi:hypothetical protein